MVEYRITEESKEAAKKKFMETYWGSGNPIGSLGTAFAAALDALCVPVGWQPMSGKPRDLFQKGPYLLKYRSAGIWSLTQSETGDLIDTFICSIEAPTHMSTIQAWADERIAEHEARAIVDEALKAGKITPAQREWALEWCRRDRRAFRDFVDKAPVVRPKKPFGPGTRLRLGNGDELLIVGNASCQDVMVVNLTADAAIVLPDSCYWHSPEFTESWLACSGATVIE